MNKIIEKFESIIKDDKIRKSDLAEFDKWFKQEYGNDFDTFAEKNDLFNNGNIEILKPFSDAYEYFCLNVFEHFTDVDEYYKYSFTTFLEYAAFDYMTYITSKEMEYKTDEHLKYVIGITTYLLHIKDDMTLKLFIDKTAYKVFIDKNDDEESKALCISAMFSKLISDGGKMFCIIPGRKRKLYVFATHYQRPYCLLPWKAKDYVKSLDKDFDFKYRYVDMEVLKGRVRL